MVGCASSTMFRRVKRPSASWNPPMARKLVGRIRNRRAKAKNGATPAHLQSSRRGRHGETAAVSKGAAWATAGRTSCRASRLLHVRPDDGVPLLGDHLFRLILLLERREDRGGVGFRGRQLRQDVGRDLLVLHEVQEADGIAVALEPGKLALVRVEVLPPELRRVRMRREG